MRRLYRVHSNLSIFRVTSRSHKIRSTSVLGRVFTGLGQPDLKGARATGRVSGRFLAFWAQPDPLHGVNSILQVFGY